MLIKSPAYIAILLILLTCVVVSGQNSANDISTLQRLNLEIVTNYKYGNLAAASDRALQAVELSTKIYGRDHLETVTCYYNYAEVLFALKKLEKSVEAYSASIEILKQVDPNDIQRIVRIVSRKATTLALDGKKGEAENLFIENIVYAERRFGSSDIRTLPALMALTKYYAFNANLDKAEDLFLKQFEIAWKTKDDKFAEMENLDDEWYCFKDTNYNESQEKFSKGKFIRAYYAIFPEKKLQSNAVTVDNGSVVNGKAILIPRPEYPALAKANKIFGNAIVRVLIDEEGNIASAKMFCGHSLFRESVENAARNAKFSVTRIDGKPIKVPGTIKYRFVR